jgi:hypothetical protein
MPFSRNENNTVSGRERLSTREKKTERKGKGAMKLNASSRRKPATKPSYCQDHIVRSETGTASGREGASTRDRQKKRVGRNEAECIHPMKACYEAIIQSDAKPTLPKEGKEQAHERQIYRDR